jgi:hypothetical protein
MYDGRMTLRWAACVHSSAALIAYIVMTVVTAFPELEYYMSTTVGWLMVGFLSRFGKFTALGVQVDLRGYVVVVMVICFYALLFLIGRWATKVLREQYKLTNKGLMATRKGRRLHSAHSLLSDDLCTTTEEEKSHEAEEDTICRHAMVQVLPPRRDQYYGSSRQDIVSSFQSDAGSSDSDSDSDSDYDDNNDSCSESDGDNSDSYDSSDPSDSNESESECDGSHSDSPSDEDSGDSDDSSDDNSTDSEK